MVIVNETDTINGSNSFASGHTIGNNSDDNMELPIDMRFNGGNLLAIIVYSILMIVSACGNISIFYVIIRLRRNNGCLSRVNLLLLHLVISDLLVTFLMMPLEIIWNSTVSWHAGDFMCRFMSFFRVFGLYLSGFILMCISIDRYFAIVKPLQIREVQEKVKAMLAWAWIFSIICSLPQALIFHVETHPVFPWYKQCVTFNSFPSVEYELIYNFFGLMLMYGLPLITIVLCYSRILYQVYKITRLKENEQLRRSNMTVLSRAKIRTVKMTVTVVGCYTVFSVHR